MLPGGRVPEEEPNGSRDFATALRRSEQFKGIDNPAAPSHLTSSLISRLMAYLDQTGMTIMANDTMRTQISGKDGFIAALDQSGGSTPGALRLYGIPDRA